LRITQPNSGLLGFNDNIYLMDIRNFTWVGSFDNVTIESDYNKSVKMKITIAIICTVIIFICGFVIYRCRKNWSLSSFFKSCRLLCNYDADNYCDERKNANF